MAVDVHIKVRTRVDSSILLYFTGNGNTSLPAYYLVGHYVQLQLSDLTNVLLRLEIDVLGFS